MITFKTILSKFHQYGEKSGWTYIDIPPEIAHALKPNQKKFFRVKGKIDDYSFERIALFPNGGGSFIMPIRAEIRKKLKKLEGDGVVLLFEVDDSIEPIDEEFLLCLEDDFEAKKYYDTLSPSHKSYFYKWIAQAKTYDTKANRIANTLNALAQKLTYPEMIRGLKGKN